MPGAPDADDSAAFRRPLGGWNWCVISFPASLQEEGLTFVDTAGVMGHFREELAGSCCSDGHKGEHIGAIATFHNASVRLTVSSMVTQELLRHVCGEHAAHVATVE